MKRLLMILPILSIGSAFGSGPASVYSRDLDMGVSQPDPCGESFDVGGFRLTLNLTKKMDYQVFSRPAGNVLGWMQDDECRCAVIRVPSVHESLEQVARRISYERNMNKYFTLTPVRTTSAILGIRTTSGDQPNIFSINIFKMCYFYINQRGEIICFAATSKSKYPDWQYFDYIMTKRISFPEI